MLMLGWLVSSPALAGLGPTGGEFVINTYPTSTQYFADVVADSDGTFVVVWSSYVAEEGRRMRARRWNSAGAAWDTTAGTCP